jgi:hypothetical protein
MTDPKAPVPLDDEALTEVVGGAVAFSFTHDNDWMSGGTEEPDGPPSGDEVEPEARPGLRGGS